MKTSWKWLSDWVNLDGLDPDDAARALTMAGLEVEQVTRIGEGHDKIVVAKIEKIEPHPKADRLVVCEVNIGGGETRQIVCGATNMKEGDFVPAALPGSQPPSFDFEIGERKMRGVLSQGMLCAGEELGLDDGVDGLLILSQDLEVGQPVFDALELKDVVFEIGVTPNRADCFSHRGVAMEIGAVFGREVKTERTNLEQALWSEGAMPEAKDRVSLTIEDLQGCPRYSFAVVEDVKVTDSPAWLVARLASVGVRSINLLVDMTNFVMFDVGQPLHAFDLDKLEGNAIVVRRAKEGETMVGIDHKEYTLTPEDLVIADANRPIAIAGVMGGEATEVSEETTQVLIECAYFDPTTVRKSAKRHSMHTESSHRFERGVDPAATLNNLHRAVGFVSEHFAPGYKIAKGAVMQGREVDEAPMILLPFALIKRILGVEIEPERVEEVLGSIGLVVDSKDEHALGVHVPSNRGDLIRPIDLVEEVARLIGFDKIEASLPRGVMGRVHHPRGKEGAHSANIVTSQTRQRRELMRRALLDAGVHEAVNFSFMSTKELDGLQLDANDPLRQAWGLANPLSQDLALMRTTLLTSLLRNLETNLSQRQNDVALFEIGRTYEPKGKTESRQLGVILNGRSKRHWSKEESWDFYGLKGLVESLGQAFDTSGLTWKASERYSFLHPGVQAVWLDGDREVAVIGRLHPAIEQERGLPKGVLWAQVDLDVLESLEERRHLFQQLSKFPNVTRDFALVQERGTPYAKIAGAVDDLAKKDAAFGRAFHHLEVFDVYEGERIAADKRSVALQVVWRALDGTMTDEEIVGLSDKLLKALEQSANATLRS